MVKVKRAKQGVLPKEIEKKIEKKIENDDFFKPRARVSFSEEVNKEKTSPKNALWFVAIITVVFLLFAISTLFTEAKVNVNPKVQEIDLEEKMFAKKDSNGEDLSFDLVVIGGEENTSIVGQGKEEVSNSAKGTVIIYNDYNSSPQALDINTRLEGSNGKIYKTEKKITVPGKKADGTPGKVEVGIYANEPGKEYNSEPLDFKILGFKGSPKYSKFYGRSKDEIIGGIVGTLPTVTMEEKNAAIIELKKNLETKLLQKTINQIPKDFILFNNAYSLVIDDQTEEYDKEKNAISISLKGTLYGLLFKEIELTKKVASSVVSDYDGSDVYIPNIKNLEFGVIDPYVSFKDVESINFKLSGPTKIVWKVDEDALSNDLLESSKKNFETSLLKYNSIDSASVVIRPFWKSSFPDKIKDININVNYP